MHDEMDAMLEKAEAKGFRNGLFAARAATDKLIKENEQIAERSNSFLQLWNSSKGLKHSATHELAKWLYRYSEMFNYDNAALSDCEKVAKDLIEKENR